MRVVYAAGYSFKQCGELYYDTVLKFQQALITNGHFMYPFSLNDMERLFSPLGHRTFGRRGVNRALLRTCQNIEPDILFLSHGNQIFPATLAAIRKIVPHMKIIFYWNDPIWEGTDNLTRIQQKLPYLDGAFFTTGGDWLVPYAGPGRVVAYVPSPAELTIDQWRAFEAETEYDLIFFGNDEPRRNAILKTIKDRLPNLRIGFFGCLGSPNVFGIQKQKITGRSKMALNLSRRNDVQLYSSNRVSDTTANGVLNFCDRASGMQALFRENEVVYYRDIEDLILKIQYYHDHDEERITMARAGWKRAHTACSAQRLIQFMIDATYRNASYAEIPWPRYILEDGTKICWDNAAAVRGQEI